MNIRGMPTSNGPIVRPNHNNKFPRNFAYKSQKSKIQNANNGTFSVK